MKRYFVQTLLTALTFACAVGCDSKPSSASTSGVETESNSASRGSDEDDFKSWKLADGTEFSCFVSGDNHAGERSWIWSSAPVGPVSFRIIGGGQAGGWQPMAKISVSDDEKLTISPDPNGKFGAAQVLPRGKYSVEFKVGTQEFSAVTLEVD